MKSTSRTAPARHGSISAHPLFPAIVALWFAALLGIGSLILPVTMFDRLAAASGDVSLAMTLRSAIALTAAVSGAALGLLLARKVAASSRSARPARGRNDAAKRPISALEELGPEGFDEPFAEEAPRAPSPEPIPGRRRPLSVTDESGPSEFLDHAPLPGEAGAFAIITEDEYVQEDDALELGEFAQDAHGAFNPSAHQAADVRFGSESLSNAMADDMAGEAQQLPRQTILRQVREAIDLPAAAPFSAPAAMPEPTPKHFPEHFPEHVSVPAPAPAPAPRASFGMPQPVAAPPPIEHHEGPAPAAVAAPAPEPMSATTQRPLAELGMVELVERFALSLQRAATPVVAASHAHAPFSAEAVERFPPEDEFAPEPATTAPPAPVIPAALRPISFTDDIHDESDDEYGLALPIGLAPSPFAAPSAPFAQVDAGDEVGDDDDGFASLLAMRSKLGQAREAVRVDDDQAGDDFEPVVTFPGQEARRASPAPDGPSRDAGFRAQPDFSRPAPFTAPLPRAGNPAATEAALRDALSKLQRISGAA